MGGIYIHIPFCKRACHYCDFHFSTALSDRQQMVDAIIKELSLRKDELMGSVESIYFGGGTPSLLSEKQLTSILDALFSHFDVEPTAEITLEVNPDDLNPTRIKSYKQMPINRFSVGIQSFFDEDLNYLGRVHNSHEALRSLELIRDSGFENFNVDLIYGMPQLTKERWLENLEIVGKLEVTHLSCYSLTVEQNTALAYQILKNRKQAPKENRTLAHFELLNKWAREEGYNFYEVSNLAKPGFEAVHNSNYWKAKQYIGIGPSAHSFDGDTRSWNCADNKKYMKAITLGELPSEKEFLSLTDRYNEYIMTGLRTSWGVKLNDISTTFGISYYNHVLSTVQTLPSGHIVFKDNTLLLTSSGRLVSDSIIASLFI